jgi:hypothetical protein
MDNPAELRRRGIEVLVRELGYANAMRFMLQFDSGRGDYTKERDQILPVLTDDEFLRRANEFARKDR